MRRARKVLFGLVPVLALLAAAEALQRLSDWRKAARRDAPWDIARLETTDGLVLGTRPGGLAWVLDPFLVYKHRPGQRSERGSINAQGFRGPDWTREKRPGVRRVILLGGSTAYGWGVAGDELTLAGLIQRQLGPERVEVWNAGVIGYASTQEAILLHTELLAWSPDALVVVDGWNDLYYASRTPPDRPIRPLTFLELEALLTRGQDGAGSVLRLSALWRRLERYREERAAAAAAAAFHDHPDLVPLYRRNLEVMVRLARAVGARAVLVPQPELSLRQAPLDPRLKAWVERTTGRGWLELARTRYPHLRDAAREVAAANEAGFVDGTRAFDEVAGEPFVDACHLTELGNQALAAKIAVELARVLGP